MDIEYKDLHREAISNQTGSSLIEIYMTLFSLPVHVILVAWISITTDYCIHLNELTIRKFLFEFMILIFPIILNFTIFSNYVTTQFISYFIFALFPFCYLLLNHNYLSSINIKIKRIPYISLYRFMLNTYTVFCILAVDFNIFPRRFAKTEKYGHSIMDIGVGLYVCSNALLYNTPKVHNFLNYYLKIFKQVLPLLVLGIGRSYFVSKVDYNHYVFEYGVHWNFFITLAFLKIINLMILPFISKCCLPILATVLVVFYQLSLSFGLGDWIMSDAPRDTFFSANREGIMSTFGYEAIFLYTLSVKWHMSHFIKKGFLINSLFLLLENFIIALTLFFVTISMDCLFGVSRRLANAGYVYWILSISSYLLFMSIFIENFITVLLHKYKMFNEFTGFSLIIEGVNKNLLPFFLFSNLMTGAVNMCFYTLKMNNFNSLALLSLYTCVIYITVYFLQKNKIKLKL
ncbi:uncharacterized protein LOC126836161 [Adelges cooleyi]|uniref:uncharacterized protein LOC126836161 n=1 Tax=Adelges cooleyi TaxID=133065 RepID=UPI00217FBD96|nr:uncharacterized protein LOC126836161 [Adelges cooleyi]